jgi:hypothetical protein
VVGEERIDVEFGELGQIGKHLREGDQDVADRIEPRRGMVAEAGEQPGDPGARHQLAGEHAIERRQRDRAVGDDLDRRAAVAEQQHRPEQGVDAGADDQLLGEWSAHHLLDGEAGQPRLRARGANPRQHLLGGEANVALVAKVEGNASDIRLVTDVGREDLQHDRMAKLRRRACSVSGRRPALSRRDNGDAVRAQQLLGLELVEHVAAVGEGALDRGACDHELRRSVLARRGRLEQQRLVAPVGGQHREGTNGFFGRRVVGCAGLDEDAACVRDGTVAEPARHHAAGGGAHQWRAGARDLVAAHDRRRRVQEQDGPGLAIGKQALQRLGIADDGGVADDVDRIAV